MNLNIVIEEKESSLNSSSKNQYNPRSFYEEEKVVESNSKARTNGNYHNGTITQRLDQIVIDKPAQLARLPFLEIRKFLQANKLYGKILDEALEEAKVIESMASELVQIEFIVFKVNYHTDVRKCLGSNYVVWKSFVCSWIMQWNRELGPLKILQWTDGHNWVGKISVNMLAKSFEYKYVIQDEKNEVKRWEGRMNHSINIPQIEKFIESNAQQNYDDIRLTAKEIANNYKKAAHLSITYMNKKFNYNRDSKSLVLNDCWQI